MGAHAGGEAFAFHQPVMVEEVLAHLEPAREGEIMDGTVGGGGHSLALLERYPVCRIAAVDRDPEALDSARRTLHNHMSRVRFVEARFDEAAIAFFDSGDRFTGVLLDLGLSTHQLDSDNRGFTFRPGAPLDMRMSGADRGEPTAADLLNTMTEDELGRVFRSYGEIPRWRRLAKAVVLLRGDRPFQVAEDLTEALAKALRRSPNPQEKAKVFQAIRVELNREVPSLERALPTLRDLLVPGGVLTVIAYESLTDRIVKHDFREWSLGCVCPPGLPVCACGREPQGESVEKRPTRPSDAEISANPRARSARLRSWRKAA